MADLCKTCPRCGSGMYLSIAGELPWICVHCRLESHDPSQYEGRPSDADVFLTLYCAGEADFELIKALRVIDTAFSGQSTLDIARGLKASDGLRVGPLPGWRAGKIRYAMKNTGLDFAIRSVDADD